MYSPLSFRRVLLCELSTELAPTEGVFTRGHGYGRGGTPIVPTELEPLEQLARVTR